MKVYHEVGVIKDGNKRVGFIMKKGVPGEYTPFMIASMDEFNKTVRDGKVQYFVWD